MIKLILIFITILFQGVKSYAKSELTLSGTIYNYKGSLTCIIYSYKDGLESNLYRIENSNGKIFYSFDKAAEEGVYRMLLLDSKKSASFDFILSSEENNVNFTFDFSSKDNFPTFLGSKCNELWYSFLKYDIQYKKNIRELEEYSKIYFSTSKSIDSTDCKKVICNLKTELLQIKNDFIKANNNKFAELMVKSKNYNDLNFTVEFDSYIDEEFLLLESSNRKHLFLNTPLFKDYVYFFVLKSSLNSTSLEDQKEKIKYAFIKIIDKFSENNLVRKCAIRYAIISFKEMNDEEIANYFSEKYNYRI